MTEAVWIETAPVAGPRPRLAWLALGLIPALGVADHLTGIEISFSVFYLIPISLVAWFLGRGAVLLASLLAAVTWLTNDYFLGGHAYSHPMIPYWNSLVRLGMFVTVSLTISRLAFALQQELKAHQKLTLSYMALDQARKEQLLIKDELLSNVSHELRTPLTAVHQFLTLLLDGLAGDLNLQQKEYLGIALRNADQLTHMIQDLLDATRVDTGKLTVEPEPLTLGNVVAESIGTLQPRAAEAGISLQADVPARLPNAFADRIRVRQVLLNLIDNALKFTPTGGRVMVRAFLSDEDPKRVCVAVSDTGRGIPPEIQKKLFQRLVQEAGEGASRKGLGLGLFISRELIQRQGGRIWVESASGSGSTFFFTLPLATRGG